jgi:hypothetical protein
MAAIWQAMAGYTITSQHSASRSGRHSGIIQTEDVEAYHDQSLLEQAINCEEGDRAAKIGIEGDDVANYCLRKSWPADREQRAPSGESVHHENCRLISATRCG